MTDESNTPMPEEPVLPETPAEQVADAPMPPTGDVAAPEAPVAEPVAAPEPPAAPPAPPAAPVPPTAPVAPVAGSKSRVTAGVLGIILGGLGIHKFYLGYNKEGLIMLLVALVGGIFTGGLAASVIGLIGLIEGIMYLVKSDEEFYTTYVANSKPWF